MWHLHVAIVHLNYVFKYSLGARNDRASVLKTLLKWGILIIYIIFYACKYNGQVPMTTLSGLLGDLGFTERMRAEDNSLDAAKCGAKSFNGDTMGCIRDLC